MTRAGLKGRCYLELKSVLLEVGYIEKWPKFAYLESKVLHLKFWVMRDRVYLQMYPPLPPQNQTANSSPNSKPPSLPKMKLPIVHLIRNPLSPPKMKLPIVFPIQNFSNSRSRWHFGSGWCIPPPGMKRLDSGQGDILVLADVPPPESEKIFLSKVRFELTDVPPQKRIFVWS